MSTLNRKRYYGLLVALALFFFGKHCLAQTLPWPVKVPFMVGGNFQDFQNYTNIPYFHGGMDLCVPAGTTLYTPVSGTVKISRYRIDASRAPLKFEYVRFSFNTPETQVWKNQSDAIRYIEVAVTDDQGRTWMYRHINAQSIPEEIKRLDGTGKSIAAGSPIGQVVPWNDSIAPEPRRYDHCHLEIIDKDGSYLNPATLMGPLQDTISPTISGIYFVSNEGGTAVPNKENTPVVRGDVDVIAAITDQTDTSKYVVAPYRIRYALYRSTQTGKEVVRPLHEVFRFDRLPVKGARTQLSQVIYKEKLQVEDRLLESQGNGQLRFFLFTLTNGDPLLGYAAVNGLQTRDLPNGLYSIEVEASDLNGNTSYKIKKFAIQN